jgi:membrane associated rhomboid family serine protease
LGVIEFLSAYNYDGVAHIAHLGGMVAGFFYIKHRYRHWGVGRNFFKDFFKRKDHF